MSDGRVLQVNVSSGGVPKLPVERARITSAGVEGDRQREVTVHGGPYRAVSILGIEAIRRVASEGHPIAPGTAGENLTIEGFDVSAQPVGTRLAIGDELVLELTAPADPCRTIRHSFSDLRFGRLAIATHPADSRMYARVVRAGSVHPGDPIALSPGPEGAGVIAVAWRLDGAERKSSIAFWEAARAAGIGVELLDDGDIAVAATPSLPGPPFNMALGFAHLPTLVDRALDHFATNGTAGWVVAEDPPWAGAVADTTFARWAVEADAVPAIPAPEGAAIRELPRDEIGPWSEVIVTASEMTPEVGAAWTALEQHLARSAHHHRFVAEIDGRPVAAGSVHTYRNVGWLRAGSVLREFRGRGLQQSLIAARAEHARRIGCDLVGASTLTDGASARNVERAGFARVGTRRSYPTRRGYPTASRA
ncbi:MAG: GNAT family N-acetyltransferase [Candidatus Limnocylindria bacterium]